VLAEVAETLLAGGWSPLRIFRMLGFSLMGLVVVCALPMRFPGATTEPPPPPSGLALWRDVRFLRLVAGMFGGTFGGLLVIGHLKPIALVAGLSSQAGAYAVGAFAVGNALGRIAWGTLYDRFGYPIVSISMGFLAFSLLGLLDTGVAWRFIGASLVAGFGFGACFVVYAAEVAAGFGATQVARLYPKIFLAYGLAGITGPLLGGWLYDVSGRYVWPVLAAVTVATLGAVATIRRARDVDAATVIQ
jgi:MFS transporter, OFA family, oxalate/formate antiporter